MHTCDSGEIEAAVCVVRVQFAGESVGEGQAVDDEDVECKSD